MLSKEASGRLEPIRDGTLKHLVAELNSYSTQDVRVDDLLNRDLPTDLVAESIAKPVPLVGGERPGDTHCRHHPIFRLKRAVWSLVER